MGFAVESTQLEYQKHLDLSRVRGDINVGRAPGPIDPMRATFRESKARVVEGFLTNRSLKGWFKAFEAFHQLVVERGGIMSISALPRELRAVLLAED